MKSKKKYKPEKINANGDEMQQRFANFIASVVEERMGIGFPASSVSQKSKMGEQSKDISQYKDIYEVFNEMHTIEVRGSRYDNDHEAKVFVTEARFMLNFTDNYKKIEPLRKRFLSYDEMTNDQLRTYFSWRTKYRRGIYQKVPMEYLTVYINEIANHIGIKDAKDGADKLFKLMECCDDMEKEVFSSLLRQSIADLYITGNINESFKEFVDAYSEYGLFRNLYVQNETMEQFILYNANSDYNFNESIFCSPETKQMMADCLDAVLTKFRRNIKGKSAAQLLNIPFLERYWRGPFSYAVYKKRKIEENKKIYLSSREYCKYLGNDHWIHAGRYVDDSSIYKIIGYTIKKIEAVLRKAVNFKYKLSPRRETVINQIKKINYRYNKTKYKFFYYDSFDTIIEETVAEYCVKNNIKPPEKSRKQDQKDNEPEKPKPVAIDFSKLDKIRKDADTVMERLIVEYVPDTEVPKQNEETQEETYKPEPENETDKNGNIRMDLKSSLNSIEINIIKCISEGNKAGFETAVRESGEMREVILERINEKALDITGDNIMDTQGEIPVIYEDYAEEIKEMIKTKG